ncbi:unnamed protein product [Musa acuminata subsp. malaccensis]|uniref:Uncharacterized protein n=1 Tax=Musa acuminata subsp. malaccensis TaxID=214687 RepID=A0A804U5K2_MUSAM|nr:unnamed protein product [Musa acuminata subsp. malaccensis]
MIGFCPTSYYTSKGFKFYTEVDHALRSIWRRLSERSKDEVIGVLIHSLLCHVSWVKNVVSQFGSYLLYD